MDNASDHFWRPLPRAALAVPLVLSLWACTGQIDVRSSARTVTTTATGTGGNPGSMMTGGAGSGGVDAGGTAGAPADNGLPGRALVRRVSNAEYDATIWTLLKDDGKYASAFAEDTVVYGFTNNTDVQDVGPALAEQYMVAAEQISAKAVQTADTLLGCSLDDGETCITDFIARFGKRAWRRPLASVEQADLLTLFRTGRDSFDATTGVELVLQAFLVSPNFLYRPEVGIPVAGQPYSALTSWEIASRLSYFLIGTMPDDALLAVAEADGLSTPEGIATEARRLLATPEARAQVAEFFNGWLNLYAVDRLERSTTQFPNWDSTLPPLLADETRVFATTVVFDGAGDLNTLLTAPFTYGDPLLANFYGGTAGPVQNGIARIELPPAQRAGILTQAAFLASHSKEIQTDPVARGKFVRERLFCQGIEPPPPGLNIKAPMITPGTTTRQRFMQHESEPLCASCHVFIDPIGLAFENYDPIGQWRDQEQGLAIDASGNLTATDVEGPFEGVVEMTAKLAQSSIAAECFVRNWYRFAFGRGEGDEDDPRIATLTGDFENVDGRVLDLLVAFTASPEFRYLAQQEAMP